MSGLEVVGVVANIIQLIDAAAKVTSRLNHYYGKTGELPKTLLRIHLLLPAFLEVIRETKTAVDENRVPDTARRAITPILNASSSQIADLDRILTDLLPKDDETGGKRMFKAVRSLMRESDIQDAENNLRIYMEMISQQAIASARNKDATGPSPLQPTFINKPFPRDHDFVHRKALDELIARTHCPSPMSRVALVGLGGVGKSQIAIEFAYRTQEEFPDAWIFWVHGGNTAKIEEGFRKIGQALRLPGWDEKNTQIFETVCAWLSSETNGRWFMVIDNADDMSELEAAPPNSHQASMGQNTNTNVNTPQILDFLPKSSLGSIVITTRNKNVAFSITGKVSNCLELEEMKEQEAMELLRKRITGTHTEAEMHDLIKHLEYMPLAISQAAAYLSRRPFITMKSYIDSLKKGNQDTASLLGSSEAESHRDVQRSHSILTTWHMTFKYVQRVNPSAARLLSLMCLFYPQGIEKTLLIGRYDQDEADRSRQSGRIRTSSKLWKRISARLRRRPRTENKETERVHPISRFYEDCTTLTDFMLVRMASNGIDFTMHPLVQLATQKWLDIHHELDFWSKRYIVLLETIYPHADSDDLSACKTLFPHALRAIDRTPPDRDTLYTWLKLMLKVASVMRHAGFFAQAEIFNRTAVRYLEKLVGLENEHTLLGVHQLGSALELQGDIEGAETMWRRAWEGRKKLLGPDNNDTRWSATSLQEALRKQGKLEEAKAVRDTYQKPVSFNTYHSDPLENDPSLLPTYMKFLVQGNYLEAEQILRLRLSACNEPWNEDAVGEIQPLTTVLVLQAKYSDAVDLLRAAMEIRTHSTSATQDQINEIKESLACALACHGQHAEAEELFRQLSTGPLAFATEASHQEGFLNNLNWLSAVLAKQRRFAEAESIGKKALATSEELIGSDRPQTRKVAHSLGEIMRLMGRREEALALYERAHPVPGADRFAEFMSPSTDWMAECVDDIRELVKTGGKEEACWERLEGDNRSYLLTFHM